MAPLVAFYAGFALFLYPSAELLHPHGLFAALAPSVPIGLHGLLKARAARVPVCAAVSQQLPFSVFDRAAASWTCGSRSMHGWKEEAHTMPINAGLLHALL